MILESVINFLYAGNPLCFALYLIRVHNCLLLNLIVKEFSRKLHLTVTR